MIDLRHPSLPVKRQCTLIGISRSSWYGPASSESPLNLALMKLIDAQFMEAPFYGSRQMTLHLRNQGHCVSRKRVRRLMAKMGLPQVRQFVAIFGTCSLGDPRDFNALAWGMAAFRRISCSYTPRQYCVLQE